jgi:hypothetical protein
MEICKGVVPKDISIDDVLVKCHLYEGVRLKDSTRAPFSS